MSFGQTQEEGRPVSVKDEGLTITPSVSSFDLTGAGVTASAIGNDVEVEIPGGGGAGSGDVVGPASATDSAIALFDTTTGKLLKNSPIIATAGALSGVAGITLDTGAALRTATSDTNTLLLQAYDVDGAAYVTFATLTAGNTPTMDLADSVTKSGGYIYRGGGTDVPIVDGGTGASDAAGARTNLGLAIGTNVQAYDATLASIAALGTAADKIAYTTALDTWAETALTTFGRSLIDDADATAGRSTLGLGTMATQNANAVAITGGTIAGTAAGLSGSFANTTDTASVQVLSLIGARATPTANDEVYISFTLNDSGSAATEFARIAAKATTVTDASEAGSLDFYTQVAGTLTSQVRLIAGAWMPSSNAGVTLGIATNNFGNVFLKNAAVIAFRNAGNSASDVTVTHATGSLTFAGATGITITQAVATTGSPNAFKVTSAAHTTLTASTDANSALFDLSATVQFSTGALTTQRAFYIKAPTYAFVGASTITTASTFAISGPPVAGTNATITVALALSVESGDVRFSGTNLIMNGANPSFNVTGTASATQGLIIKGNVTAAGAGAELTVKGTTTRTAGILLQVQNNATNKFVVNWDGGTTWTQSVNTTGAPALLTLTGAAHTTLTASGSFTDININLAQTKQMATGAVTFAKIINITAPTLAFVGASTVTDAATLYISGPPAAGTNATITSPYAFYSASGINAFGGDVRFLQQSTEFLVYGTQTSTTYFIIRGNQSAAGTGSDVRIGTSATRTAGWILQLSNVNTVNAQWDYTGGYEMIQSAGATGVRHSLKITAGAHTNQTLSTESPEILFDLSATKQFATGALTAQRSVKILAPTYAFVGASTITDAATLYVSAAPIAGTNATITNTWAVWVDAGTSRFDGMLDLSAIAAGSPNLKITATSDTPTVAFTGGANAPTTAPAGYMEINVGGNARYIPYWA